MAHDRTPFKLIQIQTRDRRILGTAATQGRRAPLHRRGKLATGARRGWRAGAPLVLGAGLTPHFLQEDIVVVADSRGALDGMPWNEKSADLTKPKFILVVMK